MMSFIEACETIYEGIVRSGHPGIIAAGDAETVWIFSPAPIEFGVMEYGLSPYFVDKATGKITRFSPTDNEDWQVLDLAQEISVPEKFRPNYN